MDTTMAPLSDREKFDMRATLDKQNDEVINHLWLVICTLFCHILKPMNKSYMGNFDRNVLLTLSHVVMLRWFIGNETCLKFYPAK